MERKDVDKKKKKKKTTNTEKNGNQDC